MKYGRLVFDVKDFLMVKKYQENDMTYEDYAHKNILDMLNENMSEAMVLKTDEMPNDIVRIYSYVTVRCTSGWQDTFQLVAPTEEAIKRNKVSSIGSLGASVMGLSIGDTVTYGLPGSQVTFTIENVEQGRKKLELNISEEDIKRILPKQTMDLLTLNI